MATLHDTAEWAWQIDLYLDMPLSKWLHRDRRCQTGLAMTVELHFNTTITDSDAVGISDVRGNVQLGTPNFTADIVNLNIGPTFVYGATTVTVAYGTPLTDDHGADGEMRVLLNRLF